MCVLVMRKLSGLTISLRQHQDAGHEPRPRDKPFDARIDGEALHRHEVDAGAVLGRHRRGGDCEYAQHFGQPELMRWRPAGFKCWLMTLLLFRHFGAFLALMPLRINGDRSD